MNEQNANVRVGSWKWEMAQKLEEGGHRVFRDARNQYQAPEQRRWAIADNSGGYPHTTEDGVLWLDMTRPIVVRIGAFAGAGVPVLKEREGLAGYHVAVGTEAFVAMRRTFPKWQVAVDDGAKAFVDAIRTAPGRENQLDPKTSASPVMIALIQGRFRQHLRIAIESTRDGETTRAAFHLGIAAGQVDVLYDTACAAWRYKKAVNNVQYALGRMLERSLDRAKLTYR